MGKLENRISAMLRENTGASILDSGGAYGRHWQKNKKRNFAKESSFMVCLDNYGFQVERNIYFFLIDNLRITPDSEAWDNLFRKKFKDRQYPDITDFLDFVRDEYGASGPMGEGKPFDFNTYNGESQLSQVLQGGLFGFKNKSFVVLQIHNGCDVRGGYTDARIFELADECAMMYQDFSILFDDGSYISTDDAGNNWYFNGSTPSVLIEPEPGQPKNNPAVIRVDGKPKRITSRGYIAGVL